MRYLPALCGAVLLGVALVSAMPAKAQPVPPPGPTLTKIRQAGRLSCAVVGEDQDYNKDDLHGGLAALDAEICKAVAIAVLGDAAKVRFLAAPAELEAIRQVARGAADLAVGVTPDATREWHDGVRFGPPVFYDRLTFMVHAASAIHTMKDLAGKPVCYVLGTQNERIVAATLPARGIKYLPMPFQEEGEMEDAMVGGHCVAIAAEFSRLGQARATFRGRAAGYRILPSRLYVEPMGPAYRAGDAQWSRIVDWTIYALQQAEFVGMTQANARSMRHSDNMLMQRLTGEDWATARALGLDKDWSLRVIAELGNYGEIYARTVGAHSPLKLPRDLNALWRDGGLIAPWPMR